MTPAERIALTERVARGLAWDALPTRKRRRAQRRARELVRELEVMHDQSDRLGWMFVDGDGEEVEQDHEGPP